MVKNYSMRYAKYGKGGGRRMLRLYCLATLARYPYTIKDFIEISLLVHSCVHYGCLYEVCIILIQRA